MPQSNETDQPKKHEQITHPDGKVEDVRRGADGTLKSILITDTDGAIELTQFHPNGKKSVVFAFQQFGQISVSRYRENGTIESKFVQHYNADLTSEYLKYDNAGFFAVYTETMNAKGEKTVYKHE